MMKFRSLIVPAAALGAALLLSGCSQPAAVSPEGTWGADGGPQLSLNDDGTLNGTDGCNRLAGGWSVDGAQVTFKNVASTRMACEGVDTWLSALATGEVDGDEMHIFAADGNEIGLLERQ